MGNLAYPNKTCFLNLDGKVMILTFSTIDQTFKQYSKDGFLTVQTFNECLGFLFNNDQIPQLAYTYLSDRLFHLLDSKQNEMIDFDSFAKGILMALSSSDTRTKILFEAIKLKQGKNYLDYDELFEFYLTSWKYSFDYIYKFINHFFKQEFIQNNIPLPSNLTDFVGLTIQQRESLNNYLIQNLHDSGISYNEPITYDLFKVWAMKDNTLEINYGNKWFRFAMSANYLELIGLDTTKK